MAMSVPSTPAEFSDSDAIHLALSLFQAYSTTADDIQVPILCASLFGGSWKSSA